ncbi:MAG: repair protein RadA [Chlorobi bacterium]|nr:repair protein RadA [Chlorobiota bacterium]
MTTPSPPLSRESLQTPDGDLNVFDMASRKPFVPLRGEVVMYEYLPWHESDPTMYPTILDLMVRITLTTVTPPYWDRNSEPRKGRVLFVSPFAQLVRVVEQHLKAAGADCSRVWEYPCNDRSGNAMSVMRLPNHAVRLRDDIIETGADLVVIDPLNGMLAEDAGRLQRETIERVRSALRPIATETHAAIVVGFVRTDLDPPDSPDDHAIRSSTGGATTQSSSAAIYRSAEKSGPVDGSSVVSTAAHGDVPKAIEFLQRTLARGPCSSREVESLASQHGLKQRTLRTARENLGIRVWKKQGASGQWMWELPVR